MQCSKKYLIWSIVLVLLSGSSFARASGTLKPITQLCRQLLCSDTAYATEQSYLLTDDVIYTTDGFGYFKTMNAAGTWADIDFKSKVSSAWSPSWHLYRLMLVYRAYHKTKEEKYLAAVHKGVATFIQNNPICPNWWQNQINVPYVYSSLMLMLGEEATTSEVHFLNEVIASRVQQKNPTGQNKIWQHDDEARIALVNNDEAKFSNAMQQMQTVISISTKEGIQPDYSFHQHGPMLQFGNYGMHFVNSLLFWMKLTAGTPFAFDNAKQQIISKYCVEGLRYSIYKKAMDVTALGRQLRKGSLVKRGQTLNTNMNLLRSFSKADSCKFAVSGFGNSACVETINKSFWRSDYMVQTQSNRYNMSVKMEGPFVSPVESINGENLRGAYLSDGVTLLQRTGCEYRDIEPIWNWNMLPGTTADTTTDPGLRANLREVNLSGFVGQVSSGEMGISAMYYNRLQVQAYKSYFMVDGMLVALGAGINGANRKNIVTTINQRFTNGGELKTGTTTARQQWLWQDSMVYVFPDSKQLVKTTKGNRTGSWKLVDQVSPASPVTGDVFTAYLPHDKTDTYVYVVNPAISIKKAAEFAANTGVTILQNTQQVQAISYKGTYMLVFYKAGSVTLSVKSKLTANQPCMVIIKEDGTTWLADATRKLTSATLTMNGKTTTVDLPKGDWLGSTTKAKLP